MKFRYKRKTPDQRESSVKHLMKWQCLNPFFENLVDSGASVKADCQFHLYVFNIHNKSLTVNGLEQYFCKNFFYDLYKTARVRPFGANTRQNPL